MYPLKVIGDCAPEHTGTIKITFLPDKEIF